MAHQDRGSGVFVVNVELLDCENVRSVLGQYGGDVALDVGEPFGQREVLNEVADTRVNHVKPFAADAQHGVPCHAKSGINATY